MVLVRAEGPKAPSPGHRPGYNSNQQGALKGQKLYKYDIENKKGNPFKGFPFCEVSSGVEPLYTVLQTVT